MCSALTDSLECYLDDLVDSFEDFVKKSLAVMTVAIVAIIAMFVYVLRVIAERPANINPSLQERRCPVRLTTEVQNSNTKLKCKSVQSVADRSIQKDYNEKNDILQCSKNIPDTCTTDSNTGELPCGLSLDEKAVRDIGFPKSSKGCNSSKTSLTRQYSDSRFTVPSLPASTQKTLSSSKQSRKKDVAAKNSCCSLCCSEDSQQ